MLRGLLYERNDPAAAWPRERPATAPQPADNVPIEDAKTQQDVDDAYERGLREGRLAAQGEAEERLGALKRAKETAARSCLAAINRWTENAEHELCELTRALWRHLLLSEASAENAAERVRALLREVAVAEPLTIYGSPQDIDAIAQALTDLGLDAKTETDPDLGRGSLTIELEGENLDATLDGFFDRLDETLAEAGP